MVATASCGVLAAEIAAAFAAFAFVVASLAAAEIAAASAAFAFEKVRINPVESAFPRPRIGLFQPSHALLFSWIIRGGSRSARHGPAQPKKLFRLHH